MRASRAPGQLRAMSPARRRSTGAQAIAGCVRSLPCVGQQFDQGLARRHLAECALFAVAPAKLAKTSRVAKVDARIDQHRRQAPADRAPPKLLADAAHDARARIETHRHVGADGGRAAVQPRGSSDAQTVGAREQPQRRRRIGRAAAEAGRHRNVFSS